MDDGLTDRDKALLLLKTWSKRQLIQQAINGATRGWIESWAAQYDASLIPPGRSEATP